MLHISWYQHNMSTRYCIASEVSLRSFCGKETTNVLFDSLKVPA